MNNVFAHHECECTCWRYSKKIKQSNEQHSVKFTMNVVTEIMVSGFLLQRSLAGFLKRNSERKKKQKQKTEKQKTANAYTNTSDEAQKL